MSVSIDPNADAPQTSRQWLWLTALILGAVFFLVVHNVQVSRYERFAPWSDADGELEAAGGNTAKGIALAVIGIWGAYLIFRRNGRPLSFTGLLPALMTFYVLWTIASVGWSIEPGLSLRRLAVLAFCILGAVGFARQFQPRDVAIAAMLISGAYLLVGVGAEMALGTFRPWLAEYRFAGTVHPNSQGANTAVLAMAAFCLARSATRRQLWLWSVFGVAVVFLLLTKSRTSLAGLAVALAALAWTCMQNRTRMVTALVAATTIASAVLISLLFGFNVDDRLLDVVMLGRQEESGSLTGRVPIWTELAGYVRARPLQGYGYAAFWTPKHIEAVSDELEWPLREAHNSYIDAVLGVGLVGAASLLAVAWLGLWKTAVAHRESRDPGFAFVLCMLVFGMIHACLETGMADPNLMTILIGTGLLQLSLAAATSQQSEAVQVSGRPSHRMLEA
jgi:O-antigen ligase